MRVPWKEVSKFLCGAFFVSSGVLFYLYLTRTPVPLLGTDVVIQPEVNGVRSIIHALLFVACLYFGYLRGPRGAARP